ncbi:methyltransferase type 11 [Grosmannia clavigera kw1407]|uniref:Methyltransferase type 11 n=1 Tax=Grosmannia clavigera (strain kw1407 / UAMH 11150) TaxID=655863 RepID=F0XFT6_GROCL|nr:methyltransferase type 11 [Grosmannia clavigera kw1407]EFX04536.1 methyltransferase type 11 [Grosmannia clavigera kw1407]
MSAGNERFNSEAATWNEKPDVVRGAGLAFAAILALRPDLDEAKAHGTAATNGIDVLEIGCGTGLLALQMAPYVRSIVAVDAAQGMIDVLRQRLAETPEAANISSLCAILEDPEDPVLPPAVETVTGSGSAGPRRKFDLITSHLVLHHIPDHAALLKTLHGCLKPGGQVALTDFEDFGPEARRFHPEDRMAGVEHHGINAALFARQMRNSGFEDVVVKPEWTMDKMVEHFPGQFANGKPENGGDTLTFPFLLCKGTKRRL